MTKMVAHLKVQFKNAFYNGMRMIDNAYKCSSFPMFSITILFCYVLVTDKCMFSVKMVTIQIVEYSNCRKNQGLRTK